jgi:RimJ/RimL family protein N-acetyltransferase
MTIIVRQFRPEEWRLFKEVRLRALQSDPGVFGSNYAREVAFPDEEWQTRLKNPLSASFGVFADGKLVGITGVYIGEGESDTASFVADWLEKDWRGKGISGEMYAARIAWVKARPTIRRMTIAYRESNLRASKAGQRYGFVFTHAKDYTWPDGQQEPKHHYELRL